MKALITSLMHVSTRHLSEFKTSGLLHVVLSVHILLPNAIQSITSHYPVLAIPLNNFLDVKTQPLGHKSVHTYMPHIL
jgi:hypothetical protein